MSRPLVSVNICMYNSSRYIDETLQSVFAQTFQNFEVVIVDDGSTDGSVELIERRYPDPRITIVRQRHQTLRVARPMAFAHSRGEYIAFLDSDDLWAPTKLERQVAVAHAVPEAGLVFSDCEVIDASGRCTGRFSDQFDFGAIDFRGTRGYMELLRCGNFIASPTPFAPAAAIRAVGGFHPVFRHVNDYELWLRLARRYALSFIDEPLARYRIHDRQFTQRRPDVTLAEQCALLGPILRSSSYPHAVRIAIGDNLLGQHRLAWRQLVAQRRYALAARALLGMCRYPDRLRDSVRHRLSITPIGPALESAIRLLVRAGRAPRRLLRIVRGQEPVVRREPEGDRSRSTVEAPTHVWIDGSLLGREQTGSFNLLSELIRRFARHQAPTCTVHVTTQASGRAALLARLGSDGSGLRFHRLGWRTLHWSEIHRLAFGWQAHLLLTLCSLGIGALGMARQSAVLVAVAAFFAAGQAAVLLDDLGTGLAEATGRPRHRGTERLVRFLWRTLPAPRARAPARNTVEILVWRGRFRWRDSHRIALVSDLTTRIHPELHTASNVAEFEEMFGYLQRHAHAVATISERSKQDIVDRLAVNPDVVSVVPMPIHPQYVHPQFSRGFVAAHGITTPYVLCVATLEPRKNLRRLVKAFELIKDEDAARGHVLALVGPRGWDPAFGEFLVQTDVHSRVRMVGFVPLEHMPSLYHFASAAIYPSVYEGFGLPVLEAMCSSAVALASSVSALPEVLGPDGIQFDPFRTEDVARALLTALSLPPEVAEAYRRRCRRRADAHFDRLAQPDPLPGLPLQSVVGVV